MTPQPRYDSIPTGRSVFSTKLFIYAIHTVYLVSS